MLDPFLILHCKIISIESLQLVLNPIVTIMKDIAKNLPVASGF